MTPVSSRQKVDTETLKGAVAEQIRAARALRGLSVRKAAVALGISPSYLSQIENGERNLSLGLLFSASQLYKVSVDVLLGREPLPGVKRSRRITDFFAAFFVESTAEVP